MMQCPKCQSKMEKVVHERIEVDRCTQCRGLWFDQFEAEDLKRIKGSEAIDDGDSRVGEDHNHRGRILCPKCESPLIGLVDHKQPHIWYESCTVCSGLFFDAGEFRDFKEENLLDYFKAWLVKERPSGNSPRSDISTGDVDKMLE